MNILVNLVSGFARSIAIWASAWLANHSIITGADSASIEASISVIVCGLLWAGIHWIEDKFKKKAE